MRTNVFNPRWDVSRKFKLMCTKHKNIFTSADRRNVKEIMGESLIGYYVRGGMYNEAKQVIRENK